MKGRAAWLCILLQDNDLSLTLPWLMFPLAASCGIGYQGRGGRWSRERRDGHSFLTKCSVW